MSPGPSSHQSSGYSREVDDQRRQKRKLSNRESARRSRMRKQQHLQDLTTQVAQLARENRQIAAQVEALTQSHQGIESENRELRNQAAELAERLRSLNSVLRYVEEVSRGSCGRAGDPRPSSQAVAVASPRIARCGVGGRVPVVLS